MEAPDDEADGEPNESGNRGAPTTGAPRDRRARPLASGRGGKGKARPSTGTCVGGVVKFGRTSADGWGRAKQEPNRPDTTAESVPPKLNGLSSDGFAEVMVFS